MKAEIYFKDEHLKLTGVELVSISDKFVSFYLKGMMDNSINWQICVNHGALVQSMTGYAFATAMSRKDTDITLLDD